MVFSEVDYTGHMERKSSLAICKKLQIKNLRHGLLQLPYNVHGVSKSKVHFTFYTRKTER